MIPRGRWQGMLTILRFNWPLYLAAGVVLIVALAGLVSLVRVHWRILCASVGWVPDTFSWSRSAFPTGFTTAPTYTGSFGMTGRSLTREWTVFSCATPALMKPRRS